MSATKTVDLDRLQNFGFTTATRTTAIVDAIWFHPGGEMNCVIGMVLTCDQVGTWKARVAALPYPNVINEAEDAKEIARIGARVSYGIASGAFPNRFTEKEYGKA